MLRLIEGGFTSTAHEELIEAIKVSISAGRRTFLFVPEQQTLSAEAEMCDILPYNAVLSFEVTNFTRFTNTAFRTLGGISGEYITTAGRSLVMWQVLTELSPVLSMTRGTANVGAGIVTRALNAVKELEGLGIKPEALAQAERSGNISDERLRTKLSDLSLIYSMYKTRLGERYSDTAEDIAGLAETIAHDPAYLDNTDIYIEGFTSFTEPQYRLIGEMMKHARLTVSLTLPRYLCEGFEYTEVRECERRLTRLADLCSVEKRLERLNVKNIKYNRVISDICDLLWRLDGCIDNDYLQNPDKIKESVRIYKAVTPFDECDFIASDIKRRVMEGCRYSDFGVIVRNTERYAGILDTAFEKAGIPSYMSRKNGITSFEAVKLISTAYNVILGGFKQSDVLTYVKCGLADGSRDECDLFETYVTTWRIDSRRFTDGIDWNMNPRGYTEPEEGDAAMICRINAVRERLLSPLLSFKQRSEDAGTVREHAEALLDLLLELNIEDKLITRAGELSAIGEEEASQQNLRLWSMICRALDTAVDMLGDTPADADSFRNQLSVIFSDMKIGSIPSYLDEVTVGQADMARMPGKKHIYLAGVNYGEFPMNGSDSSYFTERDKRVLAALGLEMEPDLEIRNARELYCFSRAFTLALQSVTVLYTEKTSSLGAALPAEVIARLSEVTDDVLNPTELADLPAMDKIYSPMQALESLSAASVAEQTAIKQAVAKTEYKHILEVSEGKLENDDVEIPPDVMALIIGDSIYLSQSSIDQYMRCPFNYLSRYVLRLNEEREATIDSLVVGNFIHSVLESVFSVMTDGGRSIAELSAEEREQLTERSCQRYIQSALGGGYGSGRTEAIIKRISRTAKPIVDGLCDEFANCRFTPLCCEMQISRSDKTSPDPIVYTLEDSGRKVIIKGKIDRVDTLKVGDDVYVRVIDYKTGIKSFSLDGIKDGENLQMLLYLKAITETQKREFRERIGVENGGKIIPAGIVYVKTSVADVTVNKPSDELAMEEMQSVFERIGASLDDERSISAMNPSYTPMERKRDASVLTYSMEDWQRLNDEMRDVVLKLAREVTNGHICADTSRRRGSFNPCDSCKFKYICRSPKTQ